MKKYAYTTVGVGLAMLCGACSIKILPSAVNVNGVVQTRPQSHISLSQPLDDQWRKIEVSIAKEKLISLWHSGSTLHTEISNCTGKLLGIEDFYVNGVSTAQLSSMEEADFDTFYASLNDPVMGNIYIKGSIYSSERRVCALFSGGSMTGAKVINYQFRIK